MRAARVFSSRIALVSIASLLAASALASPKKRAPPAPKPIEGESHPEEKSELIFSWVPGGRVHLGCEPQDGQCFDDEKPGREATLRGFWMEQSVVTVDAWKACVAAKACAEPKPGEGCNWGMGRGDHPINCVTFDEARAFCAWVGGRLPGADEWELAAKGGESRVYPWGDTLPNATYAKDKVPWRGTEPIGSRPGGASRAGLLDLVGNVGQWTSTDYDARHKEIRGGPVFLRNSNRGHEEPATRAAAIGLRCLRTEAP